MRKWALLVVTIVVFTAFAGCLGGEAEPENKEPVKMQKNGMIEKQEGWIEDDGNEHAYSEISIPVNDSNLIRVKISVRVEDSDAAHSETDQGSDPDNVIVTVSNGNATETQEGPTPFSYSFEFKVLGGAETTEYLAQGWSVTIDAALGGGKPRFVFGFIIWVDQGVAYSIDGDYTYLEIEGEETVTEPTA
jgi:hypothetical protein